MRSDEWNGARIAVVSSPEGSCAGLDASPVESTPEAGDQAWWTAAAAGLRQAIPDLARLTLVVPEAWLAAGATGAARLETARSVLVGLARLRFGVVSRAAAVAAHHDHAAPKRPGVRWVVVVHLGPGEVRATICHGRGTAVAVGATGARPLPGSSLRASLLGARPGPEVEADAEDLPRLVRHGLERLGVALAAASHNPAFLEVPVVGPSSAPPDRWLTARQVRDLLAGRPEALRSAVGGLASWVADAELPVAVTIVVTGPDREDTVSHEVLVDAVGTWVHVPKPALAVAPAVAAAEGAALVAVGQVAAESVPARTFSLPVHRIAGGQAVSQTLPLADPDDPGPLVVAEEGARPVCVDVSGPRGTERATVAGAESLPAGRYRVGIWPGWDSATLVMRPVDGGAPLLYALALDGAGRSGLRKAGEE